MRESQENIGVQKDHEEDVSRKKKIHKHLAKPRISIDALQPMIVDRTDIQSPIKTDNPMVLPTAQSKDSLSREDHDREESVVYPESIPDSIPEEQVPQKKVHIDGEIVEEEVVEPPESKEIQKTGQDDVKIEINQPAEHDNNKEEGSTPASEASNTSGSTKASTQVSALPESNQQNAQSLVTQVSQTAAPTVDASASVAKAKLALSKQHNEQIPKQPEVSFWSLICPCFCLPTKVEQETVQLKEIPTEKQVMPVDPSSPRLLPPQDSDMTGRKCLVLDLDETLLHSSFKPVSAYDFTIKVEIDSVVHSIFVLKRPFVARFLEEMAKIYELVIFTASLSKYADPVLDILDPKRLIKYRLFRESCTFFKGSYIKDLSLLGRDLAKTIIIDNSPTCYMFQPTNAVPIASWFDDPNDQELLDLIPFLEDLSTVEDVRFVLDTSQENS